MREPPKWYDSNTDNPPWIKALAEVRRLAPREGWRYQHVQAIIVSIDQYAEAALGNREFFLNKPYGIGGGMKDDIPGRPVTVHLIKLTQERAITTFVWVHSDEERGIGDAPNYAALNAVIAELA